MVKRPGKKYLQKMHFSDGDVIADEPEEILEDSDDFQLAEPGCCL